MIASQIVTENQLDEWVRANAHTAQGKIVELIWRLVCASCPRATFRRFPLPDSISQHGADGELEADVDFLPFVPEGKSHWEIGCSIDALRKANSDYGDATSAVPEEIRKKTTFIFVTPLSGRRGWKDTWKPEGIQTWMEEKRSLEEWKGVRVIDGTQIVDWLTHFPAVGHWLGKLLGRLPDDFETSESHWEIISNIGAPPQLLPDLFVCGRDRGAEKLRQVLVDRTSTQLRIDTHYPGDVADFVSASVATYSDDERLEQFGRILIFQDAESWKRACTLPQPHILVADFDIDSAEGHKLIQRGLGQRHAVIYRGPPGGPPHGNAVNLLRAKAHQMSECLTKSGYSTERARTAINRAGNDLGALLRLLSGLSALPDWATQSEAVDLAIAQFVAGWDESRDGDVEVITALAGKDFREWIAAIRKVHSAQPAPLDYFDGRWKFTSRFEPWLYLGPQIGSETLEAFGRLAVAVLSELDPTLELPKEERFAASIHGKVRRYSSALRGGMAETVALLGARGDALCSCPPGQPKTVARRVVEDLLRNADSIRWASLNDILPLLAEASPDAFLQAVGGASEHPEQPFSGVFAEEGSGFAGRNYTTGLLWALESLAWNADYLGRACRILANLAAIDPGGKWSNRPDNSLVAILLPWFPQTCADKEQRHVVVRSVTAEQPEMGWRLLLGLLPQLHGMTMPTHKPKWQDWIPADWREGATVRERIDDEGFYADLALKQAGTDIERLIKLIDYYFLLRPKFRQAFRARLESPEIAGLPDKERLSLWSTLSIKVQNHRKYGDSPAWHVPNDALADLDELARKLVPTKPEVQHQRLFSGDDFNLFEDTGDWEAQRQKLQQKRIDAIREIVDEGGFAGLLSFLASVKAPGEVGSAYGADAERNDDSRVLPAMLESEADEQRHFAASYIWVRYRHGGWEWVDQVDRLGWQPEVLAAFYSVLPFISETWDRVAADMGDNQREYWTRTGTFPDREKLNNIGHALAMLLEHDRPDSVIEFLRFGQLRDPEFSEFSLRALTALGAEHRIDQHSICEVFNELHKDTSIDEKRLAALEWKFLELLGQFSGSRPLTLRRHLAEQPEFFCEVIRMLYRSRKDSKTEDASTCEVEAGEQESQKAQAARCAYHLLHDWDYPPGLQKDGTFDGRKLGQWFQRVERECVETGHWEVASLKIGEVMFYAPRRDDGLWMEPVCAILDQKDGERLRRGLTLQIFNSRGVHGFSGGQEEIELAEQWEGLAKLAESEGFPRLGESLCGLGKEYREFAKQSILEHEHDFD